MSQSPRGHEGFDVGSCSESHLLPFDLRALLPRSSPPSPWVSFGSFAPWFTFIGFFFLAGLTWAAMRGPLVSAWELWAVSLAARETAAAAPRPWTWGPAATSHSPLLQCQTPASLLFQKPATPGQVWRSPSRVQVVAKCHQADLMRHLKSAFLPDCHGHRCLGRRDKCPNWLPTRGLFLSQVTVPLCHSPSHMTSSIRNLQSLPRLPFVTARARHPRPSLV